MKLGVVITMYDEHDLVLKSMENIKKKFSQSTIVVIQSDDTRVTEEIKQINDIADVFIKLPDLDGEYDNFSLPSKVITRNLSRGFTELYNLGEEFDCIVSFTGDTLITDANNFSRRYDSMLTNKWLGMVSQAVGQNFHAPTDNPKNGVVGGRYQSSETTDFACCLFILKGIEALKSKAFSNIKITNKWTSEQCLGDEMINFVGENFHDKIGILNAHAPYVAYAYNDGVVYHARTDGRAGR